MRMGIKNKFRFNSPVILGFVLISFLSLLLGIATNGYTNSLIFGVYRSSPADPLFYVRLVGHVFGHAGWEHFSGNMMLLLLIGPLLEEKYGSRNICIVILATAVITGLINIIFHPSVMLLGASGVVFALILLSSLTSVKDGKIPITFIIVAIIYIGGEISKGIFVKDDVSNLTHVAGGLIGGGFGLLLNRKKNTY